MSQDEDQNDDLDQEWRTRNAQLGVVFSAGAEPPSPRDIERGNDPDGGGDHPVSNGIFDHPLIERDDKICSSCDTELKGSFYDVNGDRVCLACGKRMSEQAKKGTTLGSVVLAIGFGLIPAAIGSLFWWALVRFAQIEAAFVALAIGFGVGAAVRMASHARGGVVYQVIAVTLTYASIVAAYVPIIIGDAVYPTYEMVVAGSDHDEATRLRGLVADGSVPRIGNGMTAAEGIAIIGSLDVSEGALDGLPPYPDEAERQRIRDALAPYLAVPLGEAVATALPYAVRAPFSSGAGETRVGGLRWHVTTSDPGAVGFFGLMIVFVGLFVALWMNNRTPFDMSGPYELEESGA